MIAGTLGNLPFKINVCAEGELDWHQEMSDMMPVKLENMQGLLKNVCTGKIASPVGSGIGSSRSSICRIVASGSESLLISEAWEIRKAASPRLIIPGHKRLHSLTEYLCTPLPPLLLSSRGHFAHGACSLWDFWGWWTLASCWTRLWSTCAATNLAKHKAVFQILCPCLLHIASFCGVCLPGLDSLMQEDVGRDVSQTQLTYRHTIQKRGFLVLKGQIDFRWWLSVSTLSFSSWVGLVGVFQNSGISPYSQASRLSSLRMWLLTVSGCPPTCAVGTVGWGPPCHFYTAHYSFKQ